MTVANNVQVPCLGKCTVVFYLNDKLILLDEVLHVPDLKNALFSIGQHCRYKYCSFVADSKGTFLNFPCFNLRANDANECTIPIRFFEPEVSYPVPKLDYQTSGISYLANAVTTRSMSRNLTTVPASSNSIPATNTVPTPPPAPMDDIIEDDSTTSSTGSTDSFHTARTPNTNDSIPVSHNKPTTTTPVNFPSLPVVYKQFSFHPKTTRFTTHQLYQYLGCHSLKKLVTSY